MVSNPNREETETLACLVIDDPYIKPRYGCMDYERLLKEMKEHVFFTEIAFIPWNYKRSRPQTVKLIAENPDYIALCVHGNDHTAGEFGATDYQTLKNRTLTALWRMEKLKDLTGLNYDPVFVFPQGRFSSTAIQVLRDLGFFAAFNSGLSSTDTKEPPEAEYRLPATRHYHNFPLFHRRTVANRKGIQQDYEAGRPLILAEHHQAFQNGYEFITDTVDWVNSLGNIRWTSLAQIAERYTGEKTPEFDTGAIPAHPPSPSTLKNTVRRLLSDFRDDYVEAHPLTSKIYQAIRKRL